MEVLNSLEIPLFPLGKKEVNYITVIAAKVVPYIRQQKAKLLQCMDKEAEDMIGKRKIVEEFEEEKYYYMRNGDSLGTEQALARYLGRQRSEKKVRSSVKCFLARL